MFEIVQQYCYQAFQGYVHPSPSKLGGIPSIPVSVPGVGIPSSRGISRSPRLSDGYGSEARGYHLGNRVARISKDLRFGFPFDFFEPLENASRIQSKVITCLILIV